MKKLLSVFLILAMLLSLLPAALAEGIEIVEAEEPAAAAEPNDAVVLDSGWIPNCSIQWILYESGLLELKGSGHMYSGSIFEAESPWHKYAYQIQYITIEEGITNLRICCFKDCWYVQEIQIPESITAIEMNAFRNCGSLTQIYIPAAVETIGDGAFAECSSLTGFTVAEENSAFKAVDGVIFSKDGTHLHVYPGGRGGAYRVPAGTTAIDSYAFLQNRAITGLSSDGAVETIGDYAFSGCSAMTSVTLPEGLKSLGREAFSECSSLTALSLPSTLEKIGMSCWMDCTALPEITLPAALLDLDDYALGRCSALRSVTFMGEAPTIRQNSFYQVTATVYYPLGAVSWDESTMLQYGGTLTWESFDPFHRHDWGEPTWTWAEDFSSATAYFVCQSEPKHTRTLAATITSEQQALGTLYIATVELDGVTYTDQKLDRPRCGETVFWRIEGSRLILDGSGETWSYRYDRVPWADEKSQIKELVVEEGVTKLGDSLCYGLNALKSLSLADSVAALGESCFSSCGFESLSLDGGLQSIGNSAFSSCTSLRTLTLGAHVTQIGDNAFGWCGALRTVNFSEGLKSLGAQAFRHCAALTELSLPDSLQTVGEEAFSGTGLVAVKLGSSLQAISDGMFYECGKLNTVTVGKSVKAVGDKAFYKCGSLTAASFPNGLERIGDEAFGYCYDLAQLDPGQSLQTIGDSAFEYCVDLQSLALPDSVTEIGSFAFESCRNLKSLTLGAGLERIGKYAFYECKALPEIRLGAKVREIGEAVFYWCSALEEIQVDSANPWFCAVDGVLLTADRKLLVSFPDAREGSYALPTGVESIAAYAFEGAYDLAAVSLPSSLREIGEEAFLYAGITELRFRGAAPSFHEDALSSLECTAYYPAGDPSWTEDVLQDYGGTVTWEAYDLSQEPPEPSALSLGGTSTQGIALSWTPVQGASGYLLEIRSKEGVGNIGVEGTEYLYTDAQMGESYSFRVEALLEGANTDWSNEVNVTFNPFSDVSGKKTIEYVAWAFNNGIVNGTSTTTFTPDDPCTRVQFVMMLWKMHGSPIVEGTNPFSDISGKKTTNAILWALDAGVINSGKTFKPNDNISRVQIVMILWKLAGSPAVTGDNPFKDVSGKKTTQAVLWAYQNGITKGTSSTTFAPDRDCTRVQLVIFLYKYNGIYPVI